MWPELHMSVELSPLLVVGPHTSSERRIVVPQWFQPFVVLLRTSLVQHMLVLRMSPSLELLRMWQVQHKWLELHTLGLQNMLVLQHMLGLQRMLVQLHMSQVGQ